MFEQASAGQSRSGLGDWMMRGGITLVLISVILAVCIPESSGPDAVCRWPGDTRGLLNLSDESAARHLSQDAESAEDLAIRYADGHSRPGTALGATMADYLRTRDQCMAALFQVIGDHHHVTPQRVRESINTHRSTSLDVVVMLSFGLLYAVAAYRFVGGIWRRFLPTEDTLLGITATVVISPVASLLGVVTGDFWSGEAEALRIGYGHLVQRAARIPWGHHRPAIFTIGVLVFWALSWFRYREVRSNALQGIIWPSI